MRGADDTKRTIQWGAGITAESQAPGTGEAASVVAGHAFDFGASFNRDPNCKPGEDPNDPECDGVQVVTGVRICGPNEDPSSGCVRDTNTRGAPSSSAFPNAAIDVGGGRAREAERTRAAQASYDADASPGDRSDGGGIVYATAGAIAAYSAAGAIAAGVGRRTWKAAGVGAGIGAGLGAALSALGYAIGKRYVELEKTR